MQSVLKMPNNAITKLQTGGYKCLVQNYIEWKNLATVNMIADLPAHRSSRRKYTNTL
jgi:hypothetical protein